MRKACRYFAMADMIDAQRSSISVSSQTIKCGHDLKSVSRKGRRAAPGGPCSLPKTTPTGPHGFARSSTVSDLDPIFRCDRGCVEWGADRPEVVEVEKRVVWPLLPMIVAVH